MKIAVLLKQLPDSETRIKLTPDNQAIDLSGVKYVLNPYDEFAVEEAVRVKEKNPGSNVTVISLGPERVKEALRTALAMGADDGVWLKQEGLPGHDGLITARLLAKVLENLSPDLILCGKQAIDDDEARGGSAVSHFLNLPYVSGINKLTIEGQKLILERQVEAGTEILETAIPAVLSAQKGLNEPRYPSLINIMQAKKKEIRELNPAELLSPEELAGFNATQEAGFSLPPARAQGRKVQGEPEQMVKEILNFLNEVVKVI